jgi:hypothetical protein
MNRHQFGVLLAALALAAVPMHGVAVPGGGPTDDAASATDAADGIQTRSNETNATFEPARLTEARLSVAGGDLLVENGLLTLRNGTMTLFVKRGTLTTPAVEAVVTNVRVVVGNRISPAEATRVREALLDDVTSVPIPDGVRNVQLLYGLAAAESSGVTLFRDAGRQVTFGEPTRLNQGNATAGPEAAFEVTGLSAPATVPAGASFTVNATITNPGNEAGVEEVHYVFAGIVVDREIVDLAPGESRSLSFSVDSGDTGGEPGNYTHAVRAFDSTERAGISLVSGGQNASA